MSDIYTHSFWDGMSVGMWDEIAQTVISVVVKGIDGGIDALPQKAQPFLNLDAIYDNVTEFAKTYRFEWIQGLTETTRKQTIKHITNWIQSGSPLSSLETALTPIFGDARARRIAVTEITRLFAAGNRLAWEGTDFVNQVRWNTARDELVCEICGPLDGTHIGIGDMDAMPPAHINCRCWISPVVDEKAFQDKLDEILGL